MVERIAKRLQQVRESLESVRELLMQAHSEMDAIVEDFRNLETYAQSEMLLLYVGHNPTLIRRFLESLDPFELHTAWLGLTEEKRQAILQAEREGESEIKADEA